MWEMMLFNIEKKVLIGKKILKIDIFFNSYPAWRHYFVPCHLNVTTYLRMRKPMKPKRKEHEGLKI